METNSVVHLVENWAVCLASYSVVTMAGSKAVMMDAAMVGKLVGQMA